MPVFASVSCSACVWTLYNNIILLSWLPRWLAFNALTCDYLWLIDKVYRSKDLLLLASTSELVNLDNDRKKTWAHRFWTEAYNTNPLFGMSEAAEKCWRLENHQHYSPDQHKLIWLSERNNNLKDDQEAFATILNHPTESHLAEYLDRLSVPHMSFAYITDKTERAYLLLGKHLFCRMSSDRKYECERRGSHCHTMTVTFPTLVTQGCLANFWTRWCHPPWFWLQKHGLNFMRDGPGCVLPCTKQKKMNICLFHACHQKSVATQPSGSTRRTLNISFIPCTNEAGVLNFNLDPWLRLLSMSVIASTPTTIKIQIVAG